MFTLIGPRFNMPNFSLCEASGVFFVLLDCLAEYIVDPFVMRAIILAIMFAAVVANAINFRFRSRLATVSDWLFDVELADCSSLILLLWLAIVAAAEVIIRFSITRA